MDTAYLFLAAVIALAVACGSQPATETDPEEPEVLPAVVFPDVEIDGGAQVPRSE